MYCCHRNQIYCPLKLYPKRLKILSSSRYCNKETEKNRLQVYCSNLLTNATLQHFWFSMEVNLLYHKPKFWYHESLEEIPINLVYPLNGMELMIEFDFDVVHLSRGTMSRDRTNKRTEVLEGQCCDLKHTCQWKEFLLQCSLFVWHNKDNISWNVWHFDDL